MAEPPVRARQARAESTRAHIVEVAAREFAQRGLDRVSLNDLVKASGVSKGAFYFHFPSKESLALTCFRAKQEQLLTRLLADELPTPAPERFAFVLRRRDRLLREDPSLGCVTRLGSQLNVRAAPGSTYAAFQDDALDLIGGLIRYGQGRGEFRSDLDADAGARVIYAAILGIDVLSLLVAGGGDLEKRNEELIDVILRGLVERPRDGGPAPIRR